MASADTARLLKRGLEIFAVLSVLAVFALLVYTGQWGATVNAFLRVDPWWLLLGLGISSLDWFGGGIRIWVLARHVYPKTPFWGMVIAGGLSAWGSYLTPAQSGGGPMMIFGMRRAGVPLPETLTSSLMDFFATVIFFAIAGPTVILLGAGSSLAKHGIPVVNISLYDVFKASAAVWLAIGFLVLFVVAFPGASRRLLHGIVDWLERHHGTRVAARIAPLRAGVDRAHECVVAFFRGRGWLAMFLGVITSALAHASKFLSGYVALRALGLHADFWPVLILQTTIAFLLYFAPTPGSSGAAEALSAALMSVYVPDAYLTAYTILWRFIMTYATVIFGSYVFYQLLHGSLDETAAPASPLPAGGGPPPG
jgi:uncharacterized protein (TIRG00374 family)